ncbi:hypothetical protein HPP92_025934 [Vanilla planifolia]|uniref:Uncharacterized protein n=1 Tax=Vanilla planifolia TaxID=51239 RepID=A0A835PIY3_VANPL|nr:hypothetical protein HPP92_025934 [Vanilla planifolia]
MPVSCSFFPRIVSILLPIVLFFTFFMEINRSRLSCFRHILLILCMKTVSSEPLVHVVGNSIWSIPPSNDFYIDWSSNRSFFVGDNLGELNFFQWTKPSDSLLFL